MRELGRRAKAASRVLALASTADKDAALHAAADLLVGRAADIVAANAIDVSRSESEGAPTTVVDRLRLTTARADAMAAGLRKVTALAAPAGELLEGRTGPDGLL